MSHEEIRKLLGGYATNTLTEAERKALFDAALEDQDLFNALHQEQALKDLLDDPVSRDQIRRAMDRPASAHAVKWWRWWAWTGAASAVAAAVLIVAVTRSYAPERRQHSASLDATQPAAAQPVEKVERDAPRTEPLKPLATPKPARARVAQDSDALAARRAVREDAAGARNERKDEPAFAPPPAVSAPTAPAPPLPPALETAPQVRVESVQSQSRGGDTQAQSQQATSQAVNSLRDQKQDQLAPAQFAAGVSGGFMKSAPVSYSVLKRDASGSYQPLPRNAELQTGDAVRLTVAPATSGYLSLSRQDASGEWNRVFPENGPGLPVSANANYTIPDSAIDVTGADQKLRLTLVPALNAGADPASRMKAKSARLKKESTVNASLAVDITIGPKKVP